MNIVIPVVGSAPTIYRSLRGRDIRVDKRPTAKRNPTHITVEYYTLPEFGSRMTCMALVANDSRLLIALEWIGDFEAPWWHYDRTEKDINVRSKQRQQSLWECLVAMYENHGDCRLMLMEGSNPNRNLTFDLAEEMELQWWNPDESKHKTLASFATA